MHDMRAGCGRHAAHRSAQRTGLSNDSGVALRRGLRCSASELNRSPALIAREAGGAPAALAPVRGDGAPLAPVGPECQPDSLHPVLGRIKGSAARPEWVDIVRTTRRGVVA